MTYAVVVETLQIVEVNANSEEEALRIVKANLDQQDPRNTARLSIAKEVVVN